MSNGTATAAITIQTAPRDLESLKKVGIFQLRMLTEKLLGGTMGEQDKMAYAGLNLDQKVAYALQLLQQWDQQNPGVAQAMQQQAPMPPAPPPQQMMMPPPTNGAINGTHALPQAPPPAMTSTPLMGAPTMPFGNGMNGMGAQAAAQMQQMPMQQMPMGQMGAMQVNPAQVAAASQNAQQQVPAKERKPRNSAAAADKAETDLGSEVLKLLSNISAAQMAQGEAIVGALKEVTSVLDELRKNDVKSELKGLNEAYGGVYNLLKSWDSRLIQIQNAASLSVSLSLCLAEQVLQTTRADVLQAAAADIPSITAMLQASQGKA
jgi:hypothetical protein